MSRRPVSCDTDQPDHMVLTDTHCHLDLNWFAGDRPAVLEHAVRAGVSRILIPGLTGTSSQEAVSLAESHPILFAAVGVHPNEARSWKANTRSLLRQLTGSHKVVAIGEIGLDYYRERARHDWQQHILREQLTLAAEQCLPVIIHLREAGDGEDGPATADVLEILEQWVADLAKKRSPLVERPGVLHSFSGSLETAGRAIRLGFYIGVTGPVTFKNASKRQRVAAALPLERILIETDAPFLTPVPHRGQRNEPAFVTYIAERIAGLQARSQEEVAAATTANAGRLFSWGESV